MQNKIIIDLLEEAIFYAQECIDEIENKNVTTYNEDRRKELKEQFIVHCETLIKKLKDEKN
jgi:hypothetical protein